MQRLELEEHRRESGKLSRQKSRAYKWRTEEWALGLEIRGSAEFGELDKTRSFKNLKNISRTLVFILGLWKVSEWSRHEGGFPCIDVGWSDHICTLKVSFLVPGKEWIGTGEIRGWRETNKRATDDGSLDWVMDWMWRRYLRWLLCF